MGRKRLIHGFFWDLSLSSVSLPLSTAAYAGPALAGGPARRLPRVDVKCSIYGCYSMTDGLETPRKLCRFAELRPTLMSGDSVLVGPTRFHRYTAPTRRRPSDRGRWRGPRKVAGVQCRFHDLRHTCITRLLERGVPLPVVASLMGWSPATTARMAKRYAHFGDSAQRRAMETLDPPAAPATVAADRGGPHPSDSSAAKLR